MFDYMVMCIVEIKKKKIFVNKYLFPSKQTNVIDVFDMGVNGLNQVKNPSQSMLSVRPILKCITLRIE